MALRAHAAVPGRRWEWEVVVNQQRKCEEVWLIGGDQAVCLSLTSSRIFLITPCSCQEYGPGLQAVPTRPEPERSGDDSRSNGIIPDQFHYHMGSAVLNGMQLTSPLAAGKILCDLHLDGRLFVANHSSPSHVQYKGCSADRGGILRPQQPGSCGQAHQMWIEGPSLVVFAI